MPESGQDSTMQETSTVDYIENMDGSQGKKGKPAVIRNYACSKCDFQTIESKAFLYHMIKQHNCKYDIYACHICEYYSRYRHKVQRHVTFAHKLMVPYDEIQAEYLCPGKNRELDTSRKRKPLMSKSMSGKKLMVKFTKRAFGEKVSETKVQAFDTSLLKTKTAATQKVDSSVRSTNQPSKKLQETGENGEPLYKCKECQFVSDDKQKVAKHALSWHLDTKSFKCAHCDFVSFEKSEFMSHRFGHRDQNRFKCDECSYSCNFRGNFERHLQNHQINYPYKCTKCSYSSLNDRVIKRHITLHHNSTPSDNGPIEIQDKKTTSSPFEPEQNDDSNSLSDKTFNEDYTTGELADDSSPYGSSKASLLFNINFDASSATMVPRRTLPPPNLESMQFLMKELSQTRKLPPNITKYVEKSEQGKLVCPACKLKYTRSSDLNRHMKRKHGCKLREFLESDRALSPLTTTEDADDLLTDAYSTDLTKTEADENYKQVEGEGIGYIGTTESEENQMDLSIEYDDEGKAVSDEILNCRYCTFKAKWPSDLKRHMAVHSIEKRFKCNFCSKKYKYIGDMNVHIRKEHNKEPGEVKVVKVATVSRKKTSPAVFKCPSCSYTTAWKSEIDRHAKLHTDDKTFQCGTCNYQTYWRSDIRRHVYKHHPDIMTEGVSLDDVITIMKKSPGKLQLANLKNGSVTDNDCENSSSPEKMEVELAENSTSFETASFKSTESTSPSLQTFPDTNGQIKPKSPTPSPIKELGGGMYRCEYCGFVANAPSKMNSHIATHTNIKRYMCPLCGKRANWKWDISKHIRKDHNDQVTQVIKLSRQDAEDTIQQYMETNPVVKREHHLNVLDRKYSVGGTRMYFKCTECGYSNEQRLSVSRHIRYQHAHQDAQILLVKSSKENSPEKSFNGDNDLHSSTSSAAPNQSSIKQSKTEETTGSPETNRPFMCSECGKKGATKGDIKKHYHYVHGDKEIRIIYLGDTSQSTLTAKADVNQSKLTKTPDADDGPSPINSYKALSTNSSGRSPDLPVMATAEPKALGYIRPFKCGLCGRRSNWKWDVSKHIKERHPGKNVKIITLTETEARATVNDYVKDLVPQLNKLSNFVPKRKNEASPSLGKERSPDVSVDSTAENVAKAQETTGESPMITDENSHEKIDFKNMPAKGIFRQFKCSLCQYRSNWRADVQRHIERVHKNETAFVIMLKKDVAEATLEEYQYKRGNDKVQEVKKIDFSEWKSDPIAVAKATKVWRGRFWRCMICPYFNEDKVNVLKHLTKHNMKAYRCTLCNWSANFRSGVYRHMQSKHAGDKTALCRPALRLVRDGQGLDEQGQIIPSGSYIPKLEPTDIGTGTTTQISNENAAVPKTRKVVYHCKLCTTFRSKWRSCVCRHLRQNHDNKEYTVNCIKKIIKVPVAQSEAAVTKLLSPTKVAPPSGQPKHSRPKNFICSVCPYRTYKAKMLRFHMRCHTPQPGVKQFKCKHCPYYVNRHRLLSQHMLLHSKGFKSQKDVVSQASPVKASKESEPQSPLTPKRHRCEKCPYTTNSKNDFIYHKQFHRPKPTADFKCDYCDYWVTHRRLLKQHMKVHSEAAEHMFTHQDEETPAKSEHFENALIYDTVEIAEIKQRIIASKITPSISQSPVVSPMKIASSCTLGGKRGFLRKDGTYRKIHRCRSCPYMNIRLRNMRLHELMHGKRPSSHPLIKCPHCDYHVGSKGLLAHHLKVHQPNYDIEMLGLDKERRDSLASEDSEQDMSFSMESKVDTLLEIARYKKYGCEKCPYASAKKNRFQRHVELHGSKQKYKCDYCDYSVPSANLLHQHLKLHFEPNQNLLAAQSILNLQHLPQMPADVALASMMTNSDPKHPVSVTHDHIDLFENAPEDAEPKKLYRCDRCPYANVRRDNLLAHLRCHMTKNEYMCPYCDYSVGKTHVLVQHVKVHFSPLPELSEWITENGDQQRMKEVKEKNITEALEIMKMFQTDKQKVNSKDEGKTDKPVTDTLDDRNQGNMVDVSPSPDKGGDTCIIKNNDEEMDVDGENLPETVVKERDNQDKGQTDTKKESHDITNGLIEQSNKDEKELLSKFDYLTLCLLHHFETVPNSKKLQTTTEMRLFKDFKKQIA